MTAGTQRAEGLTMNRSETGYRGVQVCALAGITYRQLDYWCRSGLVEPSMAAAKGSGSQRLYTDLDLRVLLVISHLIRSGASLGAIRRNGMVAQLRALDPDVWDDGLVVITTDGRVFPTLAPGAAMADAALTVAWVVNLSALLPDHEEEVTDHGVLAVPRPVPAG